MFDWIDEKTNNQHHVFFTLENFYNPDTTKAHLRKPAVHPNIAPRRCIVLDFDLKESRYDDPIKLAHYLKLMFPQEPHSMVLSGGGVHVYYVLEDDVSLEQMRAFRNQSSELFKKARLAKVDMNFKGAHAERSVIRCPCTYNWKSDYYPDYPFTRYQVFGNTYEIGEILDELPIERVPVESYLFPGVRPTAVVAKLQRVPPIPCQSVEVSMADVRKGCAAAEKYYQLSKAGFLENGQVKGDRSDVAMFANLCHHTVPDYGLSGDREKEFLAISGTFPDSTRDYLKGDIWDSFMKGPTMDKPWQCHKWGQMSDQCRGCKHNKTPDFSPWKAGHARFEAPPPKPPTESEVKVERQRKASRYTVDEEGVRIRANLDGEWIVVKITTVPMKILYKFEEHGERKIMLESEGKRRKLLYKSFASAPGSASALLSIGITVLNANYAQKFIKEQHDIAPYRDVHESFGWLGKNKFITPFEVIGDKSTTSPDFRWTPEKNAERYGERPEGTADEWVSLVSGLNYTAFLPHQCLILSSFASPLFEVLDGIVNTKGFVVNLHSARSGTGKSTALKIAQSVFYSPRDWAVRFSDTDIAQWEQLRLHKNLPVTWDEITVGDPDRMTKTVFYTTGGRSRGRMDSFEHKYEEGGFRTFLLTTSNVALQSMVSQSDQASNEAAYYRGIDLAAHKIEDFDDPRLAKIKYIESHIIDQYGHIGKEFLMYCIANKEAIRQQAQYLMANSIPNECDRFTKEWSLLLLTAMHILDCMGKVFFDHQRLTSFILKRTSKTALEVKDAVREAIDSPLDFIRMNATRMLTSVSPKMNKALKQRIVNDNIASNEAIRRVELTSFMGNMRMRKRYIAKGIEYNIPMPMLKKFYGKKLPDIKKYWQTLEGCEIKNIRISGESKRCMVFWTKTDVIPHEDNINDEEYPSDDGGGSV